MDGASENATKSWVLALTAAAASMVALDALVVATALGAIRHDLGVSIEALEWTVNAYALSFAAFLLIGKASGTLSTIRQLGGAFGVALTVAVFARVGSHATPMAFARGFAAAIGVAALLSLAGAGAGLSLRGTRKARIAPSAGPALLSSLNDKA